MQECRKKLLDGKDLSTTFEKEGFEGQDRTVLGEGIYSCWSSFLEGSLENYYFQSVMC